MTLDDTSGDKNRHFPGTIQEITLKSCILPNSRTRAFVLRAHSGDRGAPMPEIGPWRTAECAGCAQWRIGVRPFGGGAGGVAQGTSRGGGFAWGLFLPGVGFSPGAGCRRGRFFAWGQISPWGRFSPNSRTESMALRARTGFSVRRCPKSAHGAPQNALGALSGGLVCGSLAAWHEAAEARGREGDVW